ncbi:MAG TPA: alkaline phosphatase family protein [Solirubrobacteraceae bacterium]|nr:alkaline phosphatase family protein [Solirubrobacteraceae bacterium]
MSATREGSAARAAGACARCGAPLAGDQRYCLDCGVRLGPRSPALERVLAELPFGAAAGTPGLGAAASGVGGSTTVGAQTQAPGAARRARGGLPGPRTAAVLVLAMLGFGTVTGAAASNPSGALNALRRGPLTLLVPPPPPPQTLAATRVGGLSSEEAHTPEPASPASGAYEESSSHAEEPGSSSGESHKHSGKSGSKKPGSGVASEAAKLPPVKHVFLIVLADQPYAQTFGPESPAPYVAHTLEHKGELLVRFYGVAHEELADEVALISGLGPTPQTAADCPVFTDIIPGQANSKGQYTGSGCIYPTEAQTIGEQLASKGLTWRVYAEAMPSACAHPEFGAADPTSQAPPGDTYATFRNPFTYFDGALHSADCAKDDVGIGTLASDLKSAKRTPAFSYIVPDLCRDGRPTPCANRAPSGLPAAETFLRKIVPEIFAAPAYKQNGLLIITTDQAPTHGEHADSSSCCVQPRFPAPAPPAGAGEGGSSASGGASGVGGGIGAGGGSGASGAGAGAAGVSTGPTAPVTSGPASTAPGATTTTTDPPPPPPPHPRPPPLPRRRPPRPPRPPRRARPASSCRRAAVARWGRC